MDISKMSMRELVQKLKSRQIRCEQLVKYYLGNIEKYKYKNAVLEVFDDVITKAIEIDKRLDKKEEVGKLAGIPIIIKDNMLYEGKKCTCASLFLKDYISQYTCTAVQKLLDQGVIILGRANMDEFAMGGSCERSAYGPCLNAYDDKRVSGGSSGGSAVAVALDMCAFALGSDTGGSIREPAAFNGLVGLKPSYGRVSRYGLVSFASSLDQIGPITKTIDDARFVLEVIEGKDIHDQTSKDYKEPEYKITELNGLRVGVIKQVDEIAKKSKYYHIYADILTKLQRLGATIKLVDMPEYPLSLPAYYIIAPAEAASNLGRLDGIKYTSRAAGCKTSGDVYTKSRTDGFGKEVKRRIMLGNFALSSGYFDAYYKNAKKVQTLLKYKLDKAFDLVDIVLMPTAFGEAFEVGAKTRNPVEMYAEDIFTIFANLSEAPAISIPCGKGERGLPLGVQLIGKKFTDEKLMTIAELVQRGCLDERL